MPRWYRVFGTSEEQPEPADLLEHLTSAGLAVTGHFRGDDLGWFRAALAYAEDAAPLKLERFLASEEGIRAQLNTWAAWLETREDNPNHGRLMAHVIQTRQLFTLPLPEDEVGDALAERTCLETCRFLADRTDGVYQIDQGGFFAADGTLLIEDR
jgi:hypothetical protein